MDVLYILGKGTVDRYRELQYSLRTLEKYAQGVDRVIVFGENPRFHSEELEHQYCRDYIGNKEYRIARKIFEACKRGLVKGDFLFMNDDHFFNLPTDITNYPYYAKGQLQTRTPNRFYQQSLINTRQYLEKLGKTTFHFDVHTPIIYNTEKYLALEPHFEESKKQQCGFVVKSLYANFYGHEPIMIKDIKVNRFNRPEYREVIKEANVFSCSDAGWRDGLRHWLYTNYPEKSKYEK